MDCLWSAAAPMTVRDVHADLSARREVAYTTVMTVLQRLARKGLARQTKDGKAHLYAPAQAREQLAAELMMDALGDVGDAQARQAALLHFVGRMSAGEAEALRAALHDGDSAQPLP